MLMKKNLGYYISNIKINEYSFQLNPQMMFGIFNLVKI